MSNNNSDPFFELNRFGWNVSWAESWAELLRAPNSYSKNLFPARVLSQERQLYWVVAESGEGWAQVAGNWIKQSRKISDFPVVGDWLALAPAGERHNIEAIVPRRGLLLRRAAGTSHDEQPLGANVDEAWIVTAVGDDLSPERIERYIGVARAGNAQPVVVLSKVDLDAQYATTVTELRARWPDVSVVAISIKSSVGLEELRARLTYGKTFALFGSSGVGKSSLANFFRGDDSIATQEVRATDSKGRHTTTSRNLYPLASGALLMDTPGMRELQVAPATIDIAKTFADILRFEAQCKFTNCQHAGEPGCAVKRAVAEGMLAAPRLANYLKLKREALPPEPPRGQWKKPKPRR